MGQENPASKTIDQKKRAVVTRPFGREDCHYSPKYPGLQRFLAYKCPEIGVLSPICVLNPREQGLGIGVHPVAVSCAVVGLRMQTGQQTCQHIGVRRKWCEKPGTARVGDQQSREGFDVQVAHQV